MSDMSDMSVTPDSSVMATLDTGKMGDMSVEPSHPVMEALSADKADDGMMLSLDSVVPVMEDGFEGFISLDDAHLPDMGPVWGLEMVMQLAQDYDQTMLNSPRDISAFDNLAVTPISDQAINVAASTLAVSAGYTTLPNALNSNDMYVDPFDNLPSDFPDIWMA